MHTSTVMHTFVLDWITPGTLSQAPSAEVLIIGCDRDPEVPVTVKIKTIKGGYPKVLKYWDT